MLRICLSSLVLSMVASGAWATNYAIGTLPVAPLTYSNVPSVAAGSFSDLYSFVFPAGGFVGSAAAVSIDVGSILDINSMQVSLLDAGQAVVANGSVGDSSFLSNQAMTPGASYFFKVSGMAAGSAGGTYAFLASASPVPEPGSWAMFAAGFAVVGSLVARRRSH